ncbi:MAG: hypothetical protein H6Q16_1561 [Bacteroidetes bacterium]|nr:hypothetical protein [Bacteroidota bacterium]
MKRLSLTLLLLFLCIGSQAQNIQNYKSYIKELTSKKYEGRGYYNEGDKKAAAYISKQYEKIGAKPIGDSYFQEFSFDVNVFHGNMKLSVDGRELVAGKEFVMREFSNGAKGEFKLYYIDQNNFNIEKIIEDFNKTEFENTFIVVDFSFLRTHSKEINQLYKTKMKGIIKVWDTPLKFYKAYSSKVIDQTIVWVDNTFPKNAKTIKIDVDNELLKDYKSSNVIAQIKGKSSIDSTIVFVAHYDHLGHLGKDIYYPGANDNASGTAMLLSLAEYYSKKENTPNYTIVFLSVAGEEVGLLGSTYYTEHPLLPLDKIKYLINLDMIADNSKDVYVEISPEGEKGLEKFNSINTKLNLFTKLDKGELAGNSDHFPFANKHVPSIFFIMETGDAFKIYHTLQDNYENLYLDNYKKMFTLLTEFLKE